jgi:hypothetical protein
MTKRLPALLAATALVGSLPAMAMAATTTSMTSGTVTQASRTELPSPLPIGNDAVAPMKSHWNRAQVEGDIRDGLQALGYTDIQNLTGSARDYSVQAAYDGVLMPLHIDAVTGQVSRLNAENPHTMPALPQVVTVPVSSASTMSGTHIQTGSMATADEVRMQLEGLGYSNVHGLYEENGMWLGQAEQNGQPVNLQVNAQNGAVYVQKLAG